MCITAVAVHSVETGESSQSDSCEPTVTVVMIQIDTALM